jgi:hypothetical protein
MWRMKRLQGINTYGGKVVTIVAARGRLVSGIGVLQS